MLEAPKNPEIVILFFFVFFNTMHNFLIYFNEENEE